MSHLSSVNQEEISKFNQLSEEWWDPEGPLKTLHEINPTRLTYVREQIFSHFPEAALQKSYKNLRILDVGCGGGLMSEPLARREALVTGIDGAEKNIQIAQDHAKKMDLIITYQKAYVEDLLSTHPHHFDIVLALEIVEHVENPSSFLQNCLSLLKPKGLFILSTLNQTWKSFALGIVAAEYILRWVPQGTHDWKKFLKPSQVARSLQSCGAQVLDIRGLSFQPFSRTWTLSHNVDVNYLLTAQKN